ncbi:MAG: vWA domain-containing protein [Verrucomicrobiales bacterium]
MSFHHPMLLGLLALPVILGFWQWVRRGHPLVLPFDHGQQRSGHFLRIATNLADTLPALLLAVAILMLAGPRRTAPPLDERIRNNIIICVDVSGSMSQAFGTKGNSFSRPTGKATRFDAASEATKQFCLFRKGDSFGLTIFGSEYVHWIPPTPELSAIVGALEYIRPGNMPGWMGGTQIANALYGCADALAKIPEGDRAVVLITDGASGDFADGGDRHVAQYLADANIRVYSILIDGKDTPGAGINTISAITGGKAFTAANPATLQLVFDEIDKMQKARFKQVTADWVDYYTPLSLAGLGIAALYALCLLGLRYTPW